MRRTDHLSLRNEGQYTGNSVFPPFFSPVLLVYWGVSTLSAAHVGQGGADQRELHGSWLPSQRSERGMEQ